MDPDLMPLVDLLVEHMVRELTGVRAGDLAPTPASKEGRRGVEGAAQVQQ
jgi:hypothetical protein